MFTIEKITTQSGHDWVVCSGIDYVNPFSLLKEIKEELLQSSFIPPVDVLFDLYQTNGNGSNRFVKIRFDGSNFIRSTFTIIPQQNLDRELLKHQEKVMQYYA
ncbi:type II toxin-antitoxin system RnlB family antitoxin [Neisseria sp. Dent CA1/247]|uniref:type II toxin-antitoxin system RnlB family antitoxin n=1 Tax=Neisseria sp. Dent CA1/247 TaxID=2912675 RepID=UPI001FD2EEE5|nr:type II toxin-antitoxin system RnlB family antitoxin [Neisseria sp. Dent CA1/247]UOO77578.1 type II toxin-antitoxin system RnlB family antitoxin [Neisseria sp. Dent CA1/247]